MRRSSTFFILLALALAGCVVPRRAEAQFIGYTSAQSVTSLPFNGTTCTAALGAPVVTITNLGQNSHTADE